MMMTMSVLLGLDMRSADDEMDTSPPRKSSPPPEKPKETKAEAKKAEQMDVDVTPEQSLVMPRILYIIGFMDCYMVINHANT